MRTNVRQFDRLHQLARRQAWLGLFLKFIAELRIDSKEVSAEDDRGTKLELWNTQRIFLEQLAEGLERDERMVYVLKGRQGGISTLTLALLLFWVAVRPRTIAALVTPDEDVRDAFRDSLNRFVASFPPKFFGDRFVKDKHNETHFLFSNGSRIDYLIAGKRRKNWGESRGYSVCLCTEVAKYGERDGLRSFMEALAQANPNRLFLLESTAEGLNHWHEMWYEAEDEPTINRIFLGWWAKELNVIRRGTPLFQKYSHPANGEETDLCKEVLEEFHHVVTMEQLAWWRWKLANSDRQSMDQNQPWNPRQAFVMSGYSFFPMRRLQERYEEIWTGNLPFRGYRFIMGNTFWSMKLDPITEAERYDEIELKVWEEPVRGAQYAIGADPAYGSSEDSHFHGISVWRCYADKMVQVAEYADRHYETKHCAWVLAGLAGAYRDVMVNLELYGPGRVVMNEFDNIRNQLRQEIFNPLNEQNRWDEEFMQYARWFMYRRVDQPGPGFVYNFECLALDTKLPTPDGWTTMGRVQEGDFLISNTGKPTQVIAVSNLKYDTKCYQITFDDGTEIVADEGHRWKVARLHWKNKSDKIRTTSQLRPGKFYIRQAEPFDLPDTELPLDPYLLGVWLGDGCSTAAVVFAGDQDVDEMVRHIEACGQPTLCTKHRTCWNIKLTTNRGVFIRKIRRLGLFNNKHIPEIYLRGSHQQRLSLLQGLMDTDGASGGNGGPQCEFVTTSKALAEGFSELVRSLGFKAKYLTVDESKHKGFQCALRYQFWFTAYPEMPVFRLARKAAKLSQGGRKKYRKPCHRIVSIREVKSVPVRCVMVDSPTSMFLAGDGMIPTHNTSSKRKWELFNLFRDCFTSEILILKSVKLIEEMAMYVQEKAEIAPQCPDTKKGHGDRAFAAALAVWAWNMWIRNPMIAAGATYDRMTAEASGRSTAASRMMDRLVYSYFAKSEQEAAEAAEAEPWGRDSWRQDRGLF